MLYAAEKLKLPASYREEADILLLRNVADAIAAAAGRDDDLADNDDLLEGAEISGLPLPWAGACDLVDVLPREQHTTLLANLMPGLYRETLAMVHPITLNDKARAHNTEIFLSDRWSVEGYTEAYTAKVSNMLRDKAGVLYGGWCEHTRRKRVHRYAELNAEKTWFAHWNEEEEAPEDLIEPEDREESKEYALVPTTVEETEQGAEYRAVDLADFYLYPANARSIEAATLTLERMLLSQNELIEGIARYGYDKDAVMELVRLGPTNAGAVQSFKKLESSAIKSEREDNLAGVGGAVQNSEDGVYECFLGFGRLPKIWDGEGKSLLPKRYWQTECVFMFCPAHNSVFKLDTCPYPWKPYTMSSLFPKNGRAFGSGMMDVLAPLAREATYWTRQTFNSIEQEMLPERVMTDEAWDKNKNRELWPGKTWKETTRDSIRFLDKPQSSLMGMQPLNDVRNRANTLFAAQGAGEIQTKVRKEAEITAAMVKADAKAQLYQHYAYRDIAEDARRRVEMELIFNPDYTGQINTADGEVEITANDLRGNFRYSVAQSNADSTPEAKERRQAAILTIQQGFFDMLLKMPMFAEQLWNGARQALMDLDREPEKYIGTLADAKKLSAPPAPPTPAPMGGGMQGMPMNGGGMLPPMPMGAGNGFG